jgi:hypothetical protein
MRKKVSYLRNTIIIVIIMTPEGLGVLPVP